MVAGIWSTERRDKHRHRSTVLFISFAMFADQVAFFEPDRQQNVSRGCEREEQVRGRHHNLIEPTAADAVEQLIIGHLRDHLAEAQAAATVPSEGAVGA